MKLKWKHAFIEMGKSSNRFHDESAKHAGRRCPILSVWVTLMEQIK
jgi:hypothetical protein